MKNRTGQFFCHPQEKIRLDNSHLENQDEKMSSLTKCVICKLLKYVKYMISDTFLKTKHE